MMRIWPPRSTTKRRLSSRERRGDKDRRTEPSRYPDGVEGRHALRASRLERDDGKN